MSKINTAFENGKAFIPFITCGDPDLETTEACVRAMADAGADLIELGIPFSDPTAEGPVIQAASERALKAGTTTDRIFDMVDRLRGRGPGDDQTPSAASPHTASPETAPPVTIPMVFMTYANVVFSYGAERFIARCAESGIDGLILPDIPFEEKCEFDDLCKTYDLDLVSLIAPTSKDRIGMIAKEAKGFIYLVSSLGVTGVRSEIKTDLTDIVSVIRESSDLPCAVGFGISTPEQAKKMAGLSDGAIVGSAIVRLLEEHGRDAVVPIRNYVREMKAAVADS